MAELTEELRVLVTAEVDKAIKNLNNLDKKTKDTEATFKVLGKTITAAMAIKKITDFMAKSVAAYREQQEAVSVLNTVIASTGAAAWTSSQELLDMASSLQRVTNYSNDSIIAMQNVLLGFKNIKGDTFKQATQSILDMATVMKMDLASAAQTVGKALDDPVNGLDSLRRQGFAFTDAQKQMIQAMLDAGETAQAQKIILDELSETYGGAAEAAANAWTQTKNAFNTVAADYGEFFSKMADGIGILQAVNKALVELDEAFVTFGSNVAHIAGGNTFKKWYDSLSDTDKLEEAGAQLDAWREKYEEALESGDRKKIDTATKWLDTWRHEKRVLQEAVDAQKQAAVIESERAEKETALRDTMAKIAASYTKLSSSDPVAQLENYKKQLDEIARKRRQLQTKTLDKDGGIIDTSTALAQLDYVEKKIQEKMRDLEPNGKKSWQKWLSEILGVDQSLFTTGKQAAQLYIDGLERTLSSAETAEALSRSLDNPFSKTEFLDQQLVSIKDKIAEALAVDPEAITEAFSIEELFRTDTALGTLVENFKRLQKERGKAFVSEEIDRMAKAIDNLSKSEKELYIEKLKNAGATDEEIEKALALYDALEKVGGGGSNLEEKLGKLAAQGLADLEIIGTEAQKAVRELVSGLAGISFDSTLEGFEALGEALGEGKDAADSMKAALAQMAESVLDQLPMLFLQAGLQLIAQGQWALGLGFVAAASSASVVKGFVSGKSSSSTEENALGGVYGDSSYSAFARGGTFTNAIVSSPTFFRFARGSGFGTGLMGEAGPEAVMPLSRGADGSLGVNASGIGGDLSLTVVVNNYSGEEVSAQESVDETTGQRTLEITVGALINSHIASGKADKALKGRYGLKVQGV